MGVQPQVIVGKDGAVHVFWIQRGKGLFYKTKAGTEWGDTCLAIKDEIRTKEVGFLGPPAPPFSITMDNNNNLHIIYISESSGSTIRGEKFMPEELAYVKLTVII